MAGKKTPVTIAFGTTVRALRIERGYRQEGFAARAGLDRSYFAAIERGEFNVSLETIVKVATALEVTAAEVLWRAGL
jgi:transcriptional regulator with XRE-family HTH domain